MAELLTTDQLRQHLAMTRDSDGLPRHEREYAGQLLDSIDAALFIPGVWHCEKCNFNLVLKTLHARTGAVTARTSPGETCPNCATALERVSYKDAFKEQQDRFEKYLLDAGAEREAREAAMREECGYLPGELDRTAPARIWLQVDLTGSNDERGEPWPGSEHVTWQDESLGGLEIEYVRADLLPCALRPDTDPSTPSRFQVGSAVRCRGAKGTVDAVTFAVIDGAGKVFYDVTTGAGTAYRVPSEDVHPLEHPVAERRLRLVPAPEGDSHG